MQDKLSTDEPIEESDDQNSNQIAYGYKRSLIAVASCSGLGCLKEAVQALEPGNGMV